VLYVFTNITIKILHPGNSLVHQDIQTSSWIAIIYLWIFTNNLL